MFLVEWQGFVANNKISAGLGSPPVSGCRLNSKTNTSDIGTPLMKKIILGFCLSIAPLTFLPRAWAAPVTLVSDPGVYVTPTTAELALVASFIDSIPDTSPDGIYNRLRNAPTTLFNPGLDAPAPPMILGRSHWEVAAIPFPTVTQNCPANTPVRITIGQWVAEKTVQTILASDTLGGGMAVIDSRNPTIFAPVSMALTSSPTNLDNPGPEVVPAVSAIFPFGELQFFSAGTGFEVARVVEDAAVLQVSQASFSVSTPFSITLEFDDAACSAASADGPQPVPILGPLQMLLLFVLTMSVGVFSLRRV